MENLGCTGTVELDNPATVTGHSSVPGLAEAGRDSIVLNALAIPSSAAFAML